MTGPADQSALRIGVDRPSCFVAAGGGGVPASASDAGAIATDQAISTTANASARRAQRIAAWNCMTLLLVVEQLSAAPGRRQTTPLAHGRDFSRRSAASQVARRPAPTGPTGPGPDGEQGPTTAARRPRRPPA